MTYKEVLKLLKSKKPVYCIRVILPDCEHCCICRLDGRFASRDMLDNMIDPVMFEKARKDCKLILWRVVMYPGYSYKIYIKKGAMSETA